jgi:hypothetical protein
MKYHSIKFDDLIFKQAHFGFYLSDKFYLQKYKELENDTKIINSYSDLLKIINNKKLEGTIHLIYQKVFFL